MHHVAMRNAHRLRIYKHKICCCFETMQFFLQCSETRKASPQNTSAGDVSLTISAFLTNFVKYVTFLLKKCGCVPVADHFILLLAFDFSYLLSVSFQIVKQVSSFYRIEKVGYRSPYPKSLRPNIKSRRN